MNAPKELVCKICGNAATGNNLNVISCNEKGLYSLTFQKTKLIERNSLWLNNFNKLTHRRVVVGLGNSEDFSLRYSSKLSEPTEL